MSLSKSITDVMSDSIIFSDYRKLIVLNLRTNELIL